MSFPRYPKYKDSGVEWLGEVPEHWEVRRMGTLFVECDEMGTDDLPILSVSIHDGVSDREMADEELDRKVTRSEDRTKYRRVRPGDLVYNMMRAWQGGFGTVVVDGMVSPAYVVARPRQDLNTRFVERLLRTPNAIEQMRRHSQGVTDFRLRLYWEEFKNIRIALPNQREQAAIVTYVGFECEMIDTLIAEQRRLMELLKEKRQAVISHAVTKGLNPHAPMKDSGVEWLGEVPAHWDVKQMKRLATIRYGIGEPPKYYDEGTPLIRATNVHGGNLFAEGMVFVDPSEIPEQRIVWLEAGDIVVVRSGAYTGDSAIVPEDFGRCIAGFDMVLRCCSALPQFVQFALLSTYLKEGQIDLEKMRAAQPHLNAEELGSCVVAVPGTREQNEIADFLGSRCAEFDALVSETQRGIDLLLERRTALISAAVTGQIDVRQFRDRPVPASLGLESEPQYG